MRSYPIISLSFLKNLKRIGGTQLENDRYSLYVLENQNLQSLFNQNVTIEKGKLFFHFNPKLCIENIYALKPHVLALQNEELADEDVAKSTNGDKVFCKVTILNATVQSVSSRAVIIKADAMKYEDTRTLLGYVMHYIVAPFKNVTLYDGRDACGGDGYILLLFVCCLYFYN